MSFRKQLDPVGSPLKFGKKQMLMARVRDNMTAQAFWAPTKKITERSTQQAPWCYPVRL